MHSLSRRPCLAATTVLLAHLPFCPDIPTAMAFWSGKDDAKPIGDRVRAQHAPVLAPPKPVADELIPSPGPVAFLPTDVVLAKAALEYFKSQLSDLKGVQIQTGEAEINDETRGLVWLDHSPAKIQLLDDILAKHKKIGWIQLPMAGINAFATLAGKYHDRVWTSAKVGGRD